MSSRRARRRFAQELVGMRRDAEATVADEKVVERTEDVWA